jgi:hypothetical protein
MRNGSNKLAHRKEQGMKTFEELKAVFTQDLLELEQLAGIWPSTIEKRHVKEQEIGRQCYEAEEDLSQLELGTLKRALGINDTRWRAFKTKFIEGSSPEELA